MNDLKIIVILMFVAAILVGIAQRLRISYPIALVVGGTIIGFIPGLQEVHFDPTVILVIVLPPILYYASFSISVREFRKNDREIFSLALGLVFLTTFVVGVIFKWLFPEYSWALAFAFGAIVSPPDAVAASTILNRFAISPRLLTILEGESLVNDASALVLYKIAVAALLSGGFSLAEAGFEFVKVVTGGIGVGIVLGIILQNFSKHFFGPTVGVVFSFTIPYIAYIFADSIGVSGVLSVVITGLIGSRIIRTHKSSLRRVLGFAAWDIFNILMNCFVFILIGLHLRSLVQVMTIQQMMLYTLYGILFTAVLIIVRMLWVYAKSGIFYLRVRSSKKIDPDLERDAVLIGWASMRGIVSLTAALALPLTLTDGSYLEGREIAVFITFVVILITLLVPGFTLAPLIRWLKIEHVPEHAGIHRLRKQLSNLAEKQLKHMHETHKINDGELKFLRTYFNLQRHLSEISSPAHAHLKNLADVRLKVLQAQRKFLLESWESGEMDDKILFELEQQLDLEESQIARTELK